MAIFSLPYVNVPVLSNTTVVVFSAFSNISLFFTNIPLLAHTPSDTTIANGVAKPKLQGHATTNIVTKAFIAVATVFPKIRYAIKVIITAGTKFPLTVSATFAIGALVLVASITSLTISEIVDSFPIFSASYSIYPS